MTKAEFFERCSLSFEQNGISEYATDGVLDKLFLLCGLFLETNKTMNLTAIKDEKLVISRHFADCLVPAAYFPEGVSVLDVGSGGGMPSLPLAVARPDLKITALDATAKKTAYIETTAKALKLTNVSVVTGRAEDLARTAMRQSYDCVTARAVARLNVLLELCVPFVKVGGIFVAQKGKDAQNEVYEAENAAKALSCRLVRGDKSVLFDLDGARSERFSAVFEKAAPTEKIYPRKYAQILKYPL